MLIDQLTQDMKTAMIAKESEKLTTIRGLISELKKWKVDNPGKEYNEEVEQTVLRKALKQRKDSITQYEDAGRPELAEPEKVEAELIENYLPKLMDESEVEQVVLSKKAELGISDKSGMGQLMGAVMQELKGKADGGVVKVVVDRLI